MMWWKRKKKEDIKTFREREIERLRKYIQENKNKNHHYIAHAG